MPHRIPNADAIAYNATWKAQQAKKQPPQQNANTKPAIEPPRAKTEPVIHRDTHKPTGETPEECRNCAIAKKCKTVLKFWYQHAPRPKLVRAWVRLVDEHAGEMVCLSGLRVVSP